MQCFREFPVAKKFMDKRGRGVSRFSVEKFFVSQCRKTSQRNLSVLFQKFPVAKKFMDKRGGKSQDVPSKFFCLTVPKISVGGNPLVFQ